MDEKIKQFKKGWKYNRRLTLVMLEHLDEKDLDFKANKKVGTLRDQFRHMANVQHCYNQAIIEGNISFERKVYPTNKRYSKKELIWMLKKTEREMDKLLKENSSKKVIKWGTRKVPLIEHLSYLKGHEHLHHGQFIIYLKGMNKKFPKIWGQWGLETV